MVIGTFLVQLKNIKKESLTAYNIENKEIEKKDKELNNGETNAINMGKNKEAKQGK
jgi:hypothetical protein